ncbi:MAG: hypothetical protein DHS20C18_47000 [Saprospiraceae bacterium]|nr:MAG: hypothetical protein DHS20C18_47000 [Saprospiraceae bacterium]
MKRRHFLRTTGSAVSIPVLLNGLSLSALAKPSIFNAVNNDSDRVLVLIQLSGGNDGLNTVVPLDQYDNLQNARSNIILPESSILSLTDTVGLHPKMTGLKSLYDDGRLGIVQSVGYPNQNRSHFRSIEIWTSGSSTEEYLSTGWIGRALDKRYPGFPEGFPNSDHPDPFAISMGYSVSETCQGSAANYSMTLNDPFSLTTLAEGENDDTTSIYGQELAYLNATIAQTNAYADQILSSAESGNNLGNYPDTELGEQLRNVALLISGGLKTKVYTVTLGGFDTHANQVEGGNVTQGKHGELLETLSEAIHAFQEDLQQQGLEERVIGMTFSEFGRQIRSNGSHGTDHGAAAPLILFGSCVNPQILGDTPEIPNQVEVQDALPMQYDFRDIYGSILMDWFEMSVIDVKKILHDGVQYLPIVSACGSTVSGQNLQTEIPIEMHCYPNPFQRWTNIRFTCETEWVRLSIFDSLGSEVRILTNKQLYAGEHKVAFDASGLPPGNYFYRLQLGHRQKTKRMVKV